MLNSHLPPAHGVTTHNSVLRDDAALAGKPEIVFEMLFFRNGFGQKLHSVRYFHNAFLALALFSARGWNCHAHCVSVIEQR
jgi:hypothetical protein